VVTDTGAQGGAGRIRQLNRPRPLRVEAGGDACPEPGASRSRRGRPAAVWLSSGRAGVHPGRRYAVEAVLERWRIDEEWWRPRPVSRLYYSLLLEDGRTVTVYRDLVSARWAKQAY